MQICKARHDATVAPIHFGSKSGGPNAKGYNVYIFRQDNEDRGALAPLCTCMPFLTKRKKLAAANGTPIDETWSTCKHIDEAKANTCDWTEKDKDKPGFVYGTECPKCGGPIVETDAPPTPVPTPASNKESLEEVRKLAAELKGETYVPLDDEPEEFELDLSDGDMTVEECIARTLAGPNDIGIAETFCASAIAHDLRAAKLL